MNSTTKEQAGASAPKFDAAAERQAIADQAAQMAETVASLNMDSIQLRGAIRDIDEMASHALGQIVNIARMARGWMRDPECYAHPSVLSGVIEAIWGVAEGLENSISNVAEGAGVTRGDEDDSHSDAIWRAAREGRRAT